MNQTFNSTNKLPQKNSSMLFWKAWLPSMLLALFAHMALLWLPIQISAPRAKRSKPIKLMFKAQKPVRAKPKKRPLPHSIKPKEQKPKKRSPKRQKRWRRAKAKPRKVKKRKVTLRKTLPVAKVKPKVAKPTKAKRPIEPVEKRPQPPKPQKVAKVKRSKPKPSKPKRPEPPRRRPSINFGPYRLALSSAIQRHKQYPRMAHRMGYEGLVLLSVRISKHGQLIGSPNILRSSGYNMLDQEAIRMVKAASPFQKMPKGFEKKSISFRVPVRFKLD